MDKLIQTLISGLSLGSIYALIALGYTMVYGIAKMLNFAHGDIIMVGAYAVITAVFTMGLPPFIAILISIALCALLGIVIEFLAYRPLRQAQPGRPDYGHRRELPAAEPRPAHLRFGAEGVPDDRGAAHRPHRRRVYRRHHPRDARCDGRHHGRALALYQ